MSGSTANCLPRKREKERERERKSERERKREERGEREREREERESGGWSISKSIGNTLKIGVSVWKTVEKTKKKRRRGASGWRQT